MAGPSRQAKLTILLDASNVTEGLKITGARLQDFAGKAGNAFDRGLGDPVKRATERTKAFQGTVEKSATAITGMSSVLGGMGSQLGATAGAVSNLASAFIAGGGLLTGFALATTAGAAMYHEIKKINEESARWQATITDMDAGLRKELVGGLAEATQAVADLQRQIDEIGLTTDEKRQKAAHETLEASREKLSNALGEVDVARENLALAERENEQQKLIFQSALAAGRAISQATIEMSAERAKNLADAKESLKVAYEEVELAQKTATEEERRVAKTDEKIAKRKKENDRQQSLAKWQASQQNLVNDLKRGELELEKLKNKESNRGKSDLEQTLSMLDLEFKQREKAIRSAKGLKTTKDALVEQERQITEAKKEGARWQADQNEKAREAKELGKAMADAFKDQDQAEAKFNNAKLRASEKLIQLEEKRASIGKFDGPDALANQRDQQIAAADFEFQQQMRRVEALGLADAKELEIVDKLREQLELKTRIAEATYEHATAAAQSAQIQAAQQMALQDMLAFTQGAVTSLTNDALSMIETFGGEEQAFERAAIAFTKNIGKQLMGLGVKWGFEGIAMSLRKDPAGPLMMGLGAGAFALGGTMAAGGAVASNALNQATSSLSGGSVGDGGSVGSGIERPSSSGGFSQSEESDTTSNYTFIGGVQVGSMNEMADTMQRSRRRARRTLRAESSTAGRYG